MDTDKQEYEDEADSDLSVPMAINNDNHNGKRTYNQLQQYQEYQPVVQQKKPIKQPRKPPTPYGYIPTQPRRKRQRQVLKIKLKRGTKIPSRSTVQETINNLRPDLRATLSGTNEQWTNSLFGAKGNVTGLQLPSTVYADMKDKVSSNIEPQLSDANNDDEDVINDMIREKLGYKHKGKEDQKLDEDLDSKEKLPDDIDVMKDPRFIKVDDIKEELKTYQKHWYEPEKYRLLYAVKKVILDGKFTPGGNKFYGAVKGYMNCTRSAKTIGDKWRNICKNKGKGTLLSQYAWKLNLIMTAKKTKNAASSSLVHLPHFVQQTLRQTTCIFILFCKPSERVLYR